MSKSKSHKIHVIKRDSGWAVKKEGLEKATKIYGTKGEAVRHATENSKLGGEVIIHKRDGSIQQWKSYKEK